MHDQPMARLRAAEESEVKLTCCLPEEFLDRVPDLPSPLLDDDVRSMELERRWGPGPSFKPPRELLAVSRSLLPALPVLTALDPVPVRSPFGPDLRRSAVLERVPCYRGRWRGRGGAGGFIKGTNSGTDLRGKRGP